ncbi:hypothetical protein Tco_0671347 [Tanacetum coccineum]
MDRLVVTLEETDERVADLEARYLRTRIVTAEQEAEYAHDAWSLEMDKIRTLQHQRQESDNRLTQTMSRTQRSATNQNPNNDSEVNQTTLDQLVTQHVAKALASKEAIRSSTQEVTNRTTTTTRTCSYKEFAVSYKGISIEPKVEDGDRVKYVACTMLDGTLTWWNSYVRSVGIDAANASPWSEFKQMLIKK